MALPSAASPARSVSPYLLLTLTPLFWACNWIVGRGLHAEIPPMAMTFYRWAFAIVFMLPFAKVGIPGNTGFTWDFVNYTPLTVGIAFLLFGGWYVLSAHKWFKGPIRQGDDAELARIEAGYDSPATAAAPTAGA